MKSIFSTDFFLAFILLLLLVDGLFILSYMTSYLVDYYYSWKNSSSEEPEKSKKENKLEKLKKDYIIFNNYIPDKKDPNSKFTYDHADTLMENETKNFVWTSYGWGGYINFIGPNQDLRELKLVYSPRCSTYIKRSEYDQINKDQDALSQRVAVGILGQQMISREENKEEKEEGKEKSLKEDKEGNDLSEPTRESQSESGLLSEEN